MKVGEGVCERVAGREQRRVSNRERGRGRHSGAEETDGGVPVGKP